MFEIGSSLREARMRNGYELAEAEAGTKIRTKYLRALEDERFELLPAQTYVKGFLRAYAEFLGLDGQLYVDEYNSRYSSDEEEPPLRPRRARPPSRAHRRVEARFLVGALAGIAGVTALVLVAWQWGGTDTPQVSNLDSAPQAPAASAPAVGSRAPTAQPGAARPAIDLVLAAVEGSCWVAVREGGAGGEPLFDGTIERGKSRRFTSAKRLWINVGSPENVIARLNGKVVKIPGGASAQPVVLLATKKGISRAKAG